MSKRGRRAVLGAAVLSATCVSLAMASVASAGVVTSAANSGAGTLRDEISSASPGEVITFNPGINPTLSGGIAITTPLTLAGNGMGRTTITSTGGDRVFSAALGSASETVTIANLTITGGHAPAGSGPGGPGEHGGGIFHSAGKLVVDGVELAGNAAGNGNAGSIGSSCSAGTCGLGGGGGNGGQGGAILSNGGTLTIRNSFFHDNFAGNGGSGGKGGAATGSLAQGGAGGPPGVGGVGGAVITYVPAEISNTTFTNNHAGNGGTGGAGGDDNFFGGTPATGALGGTGGAISQGAILPPMPITGSTFSGNVAGVGGTGGSAAFAAPGGSGGDGGAVFASSATIVNSTFTANQGGVGGIGGAGASATLGAGGSGGAGGAFSGFGTIRASTFAANHAGVGGNGSTPGPAGAGGGVRTQNSSSVLEGSIVANNVVGASTADPTANCSGPFNGSFVLSFPGGTGCPGAVGNPLLGPLAGNGGPTQTMALGTGSPAIDQWPASAANCPPTDQRGVTRPQAGACDIGAFELAPTPPAASLGSLGSFNLKAAIRRCKKKFPKGPKRRKCIRKAKRRAQQ